MKKFLTLLCILIQILSLSACSKIEPEPPTSHTLQPSPTTTEPTPAVADEDLYPGTPVTLGHLLNAEYDSFSQAIYDEIAEDYKKYDAMDQTDRMVSSHSPGVCRNSFSTWQEATAFVGAQPWNPLEDPTWMEDIKAKETEETHQTDMVGADWPRLNYSALYSGNREGEIFSLVLQSDYYLEHGFVNEMILLCNPKGHHSAWIEGDQVGDYAGFSFDVPSDAGKETMTAEFMVVHSGLYDAVRLALPKSQNYKYMFNITSHSGTEDLAVYFNRVCEYVGIPLDYDGLMQLIGKS